MLSATKRNTKAKRKRLSAETRRQQLLNFAVLTSAKNGLGNAKHAEIAKLAGVAVSTVFFYFPSVEVLNNAVIDEVEKTISLDHLSQIIAEQSNESLFDMLDKFIQTYDQLIVDNNDCVVLFLQWGCSINNSMWPRYHDYRNKQLATLTKSLQLSQQRGEIRSDLDLDTTAKIIAAQLKMLLNMRCFPDTEQAIKETTLYLRNYLLK